MYFVLSCIPHTQSPKAVKMEKQENRVIHNHNVQQLCAVIREERA